LIKGAVEGVFALSMKKENVGVGKFGIMKK